MSAKVLIVKPGMDPHYRGAITVARYLRDCGMEVIYLGNQLPEQTVEAALQEDPDVIGLSCLSGNHKVFVPRLMEQLRAHGLADVVVLVGGVIPEQDKPELKRLGVARVFGVGSSLESIAEFIRSHVQDGTKGTYARST